MSEDVVFEPVDSASIPSSVHESATVASILALIALTAATTFVLASFPVGEDPSPTLARLLSLLVLGLSGLLLHLGSTLGVDFAWKTRGLHLGWLFGLLFILMVEISIEPGPAWTGAVFPYVFLGAGLVGIPWIGVLASIRFWVFGASSSGGRQAAWKGGAMLCLGLGLAPWVALLWGVLELPPNAAWLWMVGGPPILFGILWIGNPAGTTARSLLRPSIVVLAVGHAILALYVLIRAESLASQAEEMYHPSIPGPGLIAVLVALLLGTGVRDLVERGDS